MKRKVLLCCFIMSDFMMLVGEMFRMDVVFLSEFVVSCLMNFSLIFCVVVFSVICLCFVGIVISFFYVIELCLGCWYWVWI